jgi:hypothetical protein
MDFAKFMFFIEKQSLHFTSLNKMAVEFDKYEVHYPYPQVPMKDTSGIMRYYPKEVFRNFEMTKRGGLVNCWHINEDESYAMWKIYSALGKGIAIQSTIQNLWDSFHECKRDIYIGEVEYVDFDELTHALKEEWERLHPKQLYLYKRRCFKFENELRVIVEVVSVEDKRIIPWKYDMEGINIQIDLNKLIEKIWISPYSSEWYEQLITNILSRYEIDKPVKLSRVNEKPD